MSVSVVVVSHDSHDHLAEATRPITALVNPDVILPPAALARLTTAAQQLEALHVPRLLNPDGSPQDSVHPLPGAPVNLLRAVLPGPLRRRVGRPGWAIAALMVARTDTLRALGPFDPRIHLFYEDLDLCLRARSRGVPVHYHGDITATHVGSHSTGAEDPALQVQRRRAVVGADWAADRRALLLEHGVRSWRARDRAWVRALLRG
jgi:GT2 family glycosyltransferase